MQYIPPFPQGTRRDGIESSFCSRIWGESGRKGKKIAPCLASLKPALFPTQVLCWLGDIAKAPLVLLHHSWGVRLVLRNTPTSLPHPWNGFHPESSLVWGLHFVLYHQDQDFQSRCSVGRWFLTYPTCVLFQVLLQASRSSRNLSRMPWNFHIKVIYPCQLGCGITAMPSSSGLFLQRWLDI